MGNDNENTPLLRAYGGGSRKQKTKKRRKYKKNRTLRKDEERKRKHQRQKHQRNQPKQKHPKRNAKPINNIIFCFYIINDYNIKSI